MEFISQDLLFQFMNLKAGPNFCPRYRKEGYTFRLEPCTQLDYQHWVYNLLGEISTNNVCLDYDGNMLLMFGCHKGRGNQEWRYSKTTKQFTSMKYKKCLSVGSDPSKNLTIEVCDELNESQKWEFPFLILDELK